MSNIKYDKLEIDGVHYKTTFSKKFINRKPWTAPDPGAVVTYIPGTVVEVHAREGQAVTRGELLCVLDAMKMRNKVLAPADGHVVKIHVKKGDKLPKNTLMFEIEQ
ncbi:MAG: acetyl-CoA carboxylase biotin carboxyl carrier protein subunit [Odoribacteraceae bacterium]|jgi:biotin carboxyl carrier protein|nr:acetyl-CoA carboxylase biotin carboxyl carrier protein subunit [Odoribacteraceae bacterium]